MQGSNYIHYANYAYPQGETGGKALYCDFPKIWNEICFEKFLKPKFGFLVPKMFSVLTGL